MTKANLGAKRHCPACGTRFYDLGKNPAKCPKCGVMHDATIPVKTRRSRSKPVAAAPVAKALAKEKAVAESKASKPVKEIEDVNLDEFEDIATLDTEEEIEELEEIEDIESIGTLEEVEEAGTEEKAEDEIAVETVTAPAEVLIDGVDDAEEGDVAEDDDEDAKAGPKRAATEKKKARK